jgi:hypothetical protein
MYTGLSEPPLRWHSGPGVKLKLGDQVWSVEAREWPLYEVAAGRYVGLAKDAVQAVRLETMDGCAEVVALARIFVSKVDAQREAAVLEAFAEGRPAVKPWTKAEVVRDRRRTMALL